MIYHYLKPEHCWSSHCCVHVLIIHCAAFRHNICPWNCVMLSWSLGFMFVRFCFRRLVRALVLSHLSVAWRRWIRLARACMRGNWFWSTTNWRTVNVTILRLLENCHRVLIWTLWEGRLFQINRWEFGSAAVGCVVQIVQNACVVPCRENCILFYSIPFCIFRICC
jgi:hypothetical protein